MNKFITSLGYIIAIILFLLGLGVMGFTIYGILAFIPMLKAASTDVKVTIISISGTAIITVLSVLLSKFHERKAEIRKDQFRDKVVIYQKFITKIIGGLILNKNKPTSKYAENKQQEELETTFREFVQDIMLWGSDESLHAASEWMVALKSQGSDEQKIYENIFLFEDFLLTIRKDLGHSNRKVQKGDLLRLFINDFDESLASHKPKQ